VLQPNPLTLGSYKFNIIINIKNNIIYIKNIISFIIMNIANIIINKFEKTNIISYRFLFCFFFFHCGLHCANPQ
jgi:hypothetical protein